MDRYLNLVETEIKTETDLREAQQSRASMRKKIKKN
jgi:hypothetical protein